MGYQVLARKWRPNKFAELVGQEHVVTAISHALDNDRLHHAYLFTGTRGVGKTTIARIFSKSLNCDQGQSAEPCGVCDTCVSIEQGNFVDLLEIDAASRTKVEDTRELLDNVQYKPTRGRFKVYLIDEVHMLSKHSFNALLKTLEEPPPHVKFLLATTDPQKLPITILSRCLQFNLKALSREQIGKQLSFILEQESIPFEAPALSLLSRAAQGSMRDALSLTDQAIAQGDNKVIQSVVTDMLGLMDKQLLLKLLNGVIEKQKGQILELVDQLAQQAPDYSQVLSELSSLLHQIALTQWEPEACKLETTSARAIFTMAKRLQPEHVQLLYKLTLEGIKELPLSVDGRTCLEMTLLRMTSFAPRVQTLSGNQVQEIIENPPTATDSSDNLPTPDTSSTGIHHGSEQQRTEQHGSEQNVAELQASEHQALVQENPVQESDVQTSSVQEDSAQESADQTSTAQVNTVQHSFVEEASAAIEENLEKSPEQTLEQPPEQFTEQFIEKSSAPEIQSDVHLGHSVQSEPVEVARDTQPMMEQQSPSAVGDHAMNEHFAAEIPMGFEDIDGENHHRLDMEQAQLEDERNATFFPQQDNEYQNHEHSQVNVDTQQSDSSALEKTQALLALRESLSAATEAAKASAQAEKKNSVKKPLEISRPSRPAQPVEPSPKSSSEISLEVPPEPVKELSPPWETNDSQIEETVSVNENFDSAPITPVDELPDFDDAPYPKEPDIKPSDVPVGIETGDTLAAFLDNGDKLVHASQINEWSHIIEQTSLSGLDKQIALNGTFEREGNLVRLLVDTSQEHLISDSSKAHLAQALQAVLGDQTKTEITLGSPEGTPSHIQEKIRKVRHAHAHHVVETDPCIQNLISVFEANIDGESIKAR
ncbi:DNA polymerase III subunit gamma/tau [Alteromonas sp. 5E99-2]|uniref:DNA polymerase III subunit gamma/tau n=1 Tax=Alteromonas sp. 5E99-2 TaxID=2817683 RepID=UPI001A98CE8B|nr:DNA polymerase III subunit gamma/tau [Alteromonas sp. 5E99-2]MBO1255933.1 DNA polymerase III subunit gamma/tau [Alteromonas sp. 5E99-2]